MVQNEKTGPNLKGVILTKNTGLEEIIGVVYPQFMNFSREAKDRALAGASRDRTGLRPLSLQNENIRGEDRRLSPISASTLANWKARDEREYAKVQISGPLSRLLGSLVERRNGWLEREDSNFEMKNSSSDVVACPNGATEPHFTTIHKPLETYEF